MIEQIQDQSIQIQVLGSELVVGESTNLGQLLSNRLLLEIQDTIETRQKPKEAKRIPEGPTQLRSSPSPEVNRGVNDLFGSFIYEVILNG